VEDVQKTILAENRILVEYFVGDEAVYVWVLTGREMRFLPIDLTKNSLEKTLDRISPLFSRERGNRTAAMDHRWANVNGRLLHDLYKTLIMDPAGDLLKKDAGLLIVADDLLNYFPFEILITDVRGEEVHYLIERHAISYVGSSGLLEHGSGRGGTSDTNLLAFGNPFFGPDWKDRLLHPGRWFKPADGVLRGESFQSLPNSAKEVKAIAKNFKNPRVFTGKKATEGRFKKLAGDYRFIHLATHYLTSDNEPMISKVVLSQARREGEDGYLQMYEVFNLHLNADLVILSGCNTGLGTLQRGEGLIGISRAFFYAGASSLVVSLWPVDDESTAILMKSFYSHLKEGQDKAAALREAKIEMLRTAGVKRDPFYWGPFVLIGDIKGVRFQ